MKKCLVPIIMGIMKNNSSKLNHYRPFLRDILVRIQSARYEMLRKVNKETVRLYWDIGKAMSRKVKEEGWGSLL